MDSEDKDEELIRRDDWVRARFNTILKVEHTAFPLVIITGVALFILGNWSADSRWLFWKLAVIMLIFIPMEIYDTWLSHFYVPPTIRNKDKNLGAYNKAIIVQENFLKIATPLIAITIPAVIFLAVTKPF